MKYIYILSILFLFACGGEKKVEEKDLSKKETLEVIPDNIIKENVEKRFTSGFPQAVFNIKGNYILNVSDSKVELKFEVSEHYDYSTDEKLKQRIVIESIKLFDKIEGVQSVNFQTNYKNTNYTFIVQKSDVEDYIKNIGQRANQDVIKLWGKYGSNK